MLLNYLFSFLILAVCSVSAVAQPSKRTPDPGQLNGLTYQNNAFGFRVTIPAAWSVKSEQQRREAQIAGYQAVAGNDTTMQRLYKEAEVIATRLLVVSKFKEGALVSSNPDFAITAEDITGSVGATPSGYLNNTRVFSLRSAMKTWIKKPIYLTHIGGKDLAVLELKFEHHGRKVKQQHYTFLKDNYAITFTLTYQTKENKKELDKILNSLVFN